MSTPIVRRMKQKLSKQSLSQSKRAGKLLDELVNSTVYSDDDSFIAHERSIVNSCKKEKVKLFEKDKLAESETPRRETYTVDTPLKSLQTLNDSKLKKEDMDEFLHVTLSRGSEKKGRKSERKVSFVTPMRRSARISAATPQYNSVKDRPKTPMPTRLSSVDKLESFPNQESDAVARNLNLDISISMDTKTSTGSKRRPSTPMPHSKRNRRLNSLGESKNRTVSSGIESTPKVQLLKELKEEELNEISPISSATPSISKPAKGKRSTTPKISRATPSNMKRAKGKKSTTPKNPCSKKIISTPLVIGSSKKAATLTPILKKLPDHKRKGTPILYSNSSKKAMLTPGCKKIYNPSSSKKMDTPNFNKIHQKAANKMESIDDYWKRKTQNSVKKLKEQGRYHTPGKSVVSKKEVADKIKKAPKTFSGIPFIPAAPSTRAKRSQFQTSTGLKAKTAIKPQSLNERVLAKKKATAGSLKMMKTSLKQNENTPLKQQRPKFDLRASLARKLSYKPHSGPLKPLGNGNMNMSLNATALRPGKTTENQVIKAHRIESRDVLRGVRKNKRFLLQMNNRQMDISMQ